MYWPRPGPRHFGGGIHIASQVSMTTDDLHHSAGRPRRATALGRAFWGSLLLALAGCGTGQQLAAGPVVGYVVGRGWSAGWEASGGPMSTNLEAVTFPSVLTHFSVGMSWRPGPSGTIGSERLSYAAWEPWFVLGGTLGIAHSSADGEFRSIFGLWEAAPWIFGAPIRSDPLKRCSPCFTVSLAVGWRWSGSGEFYMSPKLGILNGMAMPWPYQTYAD